MKTSILSAIPSAPSRNSLFGKPFSPDLNPWFAVSGELRRHEAMRTRADAVLLEYIKKRRNEPPGHDLLQTLMDARYSDGEGMSDELILSESMQLLVAGHETSSNALSWLFYLLSSRPDCLEEGKAGI